MFHINNFNDYRFYAVWQKQSMAQQQTSLESTETCQTTRPM